MLVLTITHDITDVTTRFFHNESTPSYQSPISLTTDTLVGLASLVLENNYFEVKGRFYRQKMGTAIGAKFSPAYVNPFMTRLEERLLEASPDKPLIRMKFIDDVLFIWMHGEEKLESFMNHLNSSHETIKFTSEQSRDSISFSDVQVYVEEGESLRQTCFASQLIHISTCIRILSFHPSIYQLMLVLTPLAHEKVDLL